MKLLIRKVHRWLAIVFALPLLVAFATDLLLSVEPWIVERAIQPGSLDAAKVRTLLAAHDPAGQARAVVFRSYDRTITLGSGRGGAGASRSS